MFPCVVTAARLRAVAALLLLTCALSARAESAAAPPPPPPPPPPPAVGWLPPQILCAQDQQAFCGQVAPGYARVEQCLWFHFQQLRPECQSYLDSVRSARRAAGREYEIEPSVP